MYCILTKNDSLLRILRFPGYFKTPLFRTFFHFPWDFEIAEFNRTLLLKSQLSISALFEIIFLFLQKYPEVTSSFLPDE